MKNLFAIYCILAVLAYKTAAGELTGEVEDQNGGDDCSCGDGTWTCGDWGDESCDDDSMTCGSCADTGEEDPNPIGGDDCSCGDETWTCGESGDGSCDDDSMTCGSCADTGEEDTNPMNCFCEDTATWDENPKNDFTCGDQNDESCQNRMDCECTKRGDEWFDHNNCGDDCGDSGTGGEKGGDEDWQHPPKDGVKALCFGWDASEPTNMNQVECAAAPEDNGGEVGDYGYPYGSCGHHAWGADQDGYAGKCGDWDPYPEGDEGLDAMGDSAEECCMAPATD